MNSVFIIHLKIRIVIINKIIDEKVSKITITDSKNEIPKDVVITILIK